MVNGIDDKEKDSDDELGVRFASAEKVETSKKPGKEMLEVANRHLAPTKIPGSENVFNVTRVFNDDSVEIGTIVSDKKRKKSSLGKNVKSAFNEWWGNTQMKFGQGIKIVGDKIEKKENGMTPGAEDRSETIQKATAHAVQPPKKDHEIIIEQVKTLSKDASRVKGVPYVIKDTQTTAHETQTWPTKQPEKISVKTRPSSNLIVNPDMRKEMLAPVVGKRIERSIYSYDTSKVMNKTEVVSKDKTHGEPVETEVVPQKTLPPIKPTKKFLATPSSAFVSPKVTEHSAYTATQEHVSKLVSQPEPAREAAPVPQPLETPPIPEPVQKPIEVLSPTIETQQQEPGDSFRTTPVTHAVIAPDHDIQMQIRTLPITRQTNTSVQKHTWVRVLIVVAIVGVAVSLALYAVSKLNIFGDTENTPPDSSSPSVDSIQVLSFFKADAQLPITLQGDKNQFLSTLKGLVDTGPVGVTQFYPVKDSGTVLQNATAWEVFTFLNTHLQNNALRSFDTISMFGSVTTDENEPFIIIRSYNFDTLFTALLAWEQTLYTDLQPLFGVMPLKSETFSDAVKYNASVRVLRNERGEEVLLYAFINRNTVVITSSTEALSKIIEKF